jgi:hypothetical protein
VLPEGANEAECLWNPERPAVGLPAGSRRRTRSLDTFGDTKLYDAVLERLFQHTAKSSDPEVDLRYTNGSDGETEMQIVVHKLQNSGFQLETWYIPTGTPNVWHQLAALAVSHPTMGMADLANLIQLARESLGAPPASALAKLMDQANSISVPISVPNTIAVDATEYTMSAHSYVESVNVVLVGPPNASQSRSPMIRWMGRVRAAVEEELRPH